MSRSPVRFPIALTLVGLFVAAIGLRTQAPATLVAQTSPDEHFKYGSIGIEDNEGMPYWIWQVLPRVCPDKLPGPNGYSSIGVIWEQGRELPVGFSKKDLFGGPRIAINCAFCHTSVYQRWPGDAEQVFPGGPGNRVDPQAYVRFLQDCATDDRFNASNVIEKISQMTTLGWTESLTLRAFTVPAVRKALRQQRDEYAWMNQRPNWGKGRIDPFNPVKFRILKVPMDPTIGNADMVSIVNMRARQGMSLHWDGLSASLREVVLSSAIGDGASRKTVDLESLKRIEDWLLETPPARWPYDVDATLAAEGKTVYDATCASCHTAGGARTGHVIPLDEIGTDRHRFDMWTAEAAGAYNAFADGYPWDFSGFRKTNGYVAIPLDAVWLRAPYLHNGSVPYLAELFEPVEQRTKTFRRGHTLYDRQRMGFVSEGPDAERVGTPYDTTLPGNGNGGHLYGIDLAPEKKKALLEYLKTL